MHTNATGNAARRPVQSIGDSMTRFLIGTCVLLALLGCSYSPVYANGTAAEKFGSAFMNFMLPSKHQLERAEQRNAATADQGF